MLNYNRYRYGIIDLSYILSRNLCSIHNFTGENPYTPGDLVRTVIQTLNKISRDYGITMDKCILLNDTWSKLYSGYYRTQILGGQYKDSRPHISSEELEKILSDNEIPDKTKKKVEEEYYRNQIKRKAKFILLDNMDKFGVPCVSVEGWEFDDLTRVASILLTEDKNIKKNSVIITKDSDLQYSTTPKVDYFRLPTGGSKPEIITYEQMYETIPEEIKKRGVSLYEYKSYLDALGEGHNDMKKSKKSRADADEAIIKLLDDDWSLVSNPQLFKIQASTFWVQDFPGYEEVKAKLIDAFESAGQISAYSEFEKFSDQYNINTKDSYISKNYYNEFISRFDRNLFKNTNL